VTQQATPSEANPGPTKCLIAYIDLLGFRAALSKADAETQQTIFNALKEVADQNRNFEVIVDPHSENARTISISPAFTSFSDNLLISFDLTKIEAGVAFQALMGIRNTACALAHRAREFGCLIRGAVTVGQLYHKDRVSFGMGLVEAYELESRVAFYPRVIVAPSVLELFSTLAAKDGYTTYDRSMFCDTDGYWCLDYMTAYLEYLGTDINAAACIARRAWALGTRAKALDTAAELSAKGQDRPSQNWAWFAERFEKSMLSINPYRFDVKGGQLEFPH
jgi:hypothetical protein